MKLVAIAYVLYLLTLLAGIDSSVQVLSAWKTEIASTLAVISALCLSSGIYPSTAFDLPDQLRNKTE